VDFDVSRFQHLAIDGSDDETRQWWPRVMLDGYPKGGSWSPPPVYSPQPLRDLPDFWHLFGVGGLVVGERAREEVGSHLEAVGELLSLTTQRRQLWLSNITRVYDCLDEDATQRDVPGGEIDRYAFLEHRLPELSLFKIPETVTTDLFCVHRGDDPDIEFLTCVRDAGLTGLLFHPAWDSEQGPLRLPDWDEV
jgi:hypothetical protein